MAPAASVPPGPSWCDATTNRPPLSSRSACSPAPPPMIARYRTSACGLSAATSAAAAPMTAENDATAPHCRRRMNIRSSTAGSTFVSAATPMAAPASPGLSRHRHASRAPSSQIATYWPFAHADGGHSTQAPIDATTHGQRAPATRAQTARSPKVTTDHCATASGHDTPASGRANRNAVGGCVDRASTLHHRPYSSAMPSRSEGYGSPPSSNRRAPIRS